jgi:nitrite reductase (NADH) large subunit
MHEEDRQASASSVRSIAIIGAGIAGLTAAEKARSTNSNCKIAIIGKEPGLPYYRLNLTRMLAGEVDEEDLALQREAWFDQHTIELIKDEVTAIEPEGNRVLLSSGGTAEYEALVLANGSHAFVPPFPGVHLSGVQVFRTL